MHNATLTMISLLTAAALAACDSQGSLGNYTDTDPPASGEGTDSDDGSEPTATSTSAGSNSGDDGMDDAMDDGGPTATGATATDDGDDQGSDDGTPGVCEMGCAIECTDLLCGPLGVHHADGCLRRACQDDETCDDGDRCYFPGLFGGCASSGWDCHENDEGTCICGGDADCGGGYCVAEEDFPEPVAGPGAPGRVQPGCAPNDGPAIDIRLGVDAEGCDAPFAGTAELRMSIIDGLEGQLGTFSIAQNGPVFAWYDAEPGTVGVAGSVTITSYDGGVAGSYEVWLSPDGGLATTYMTGSFTELPFCDVEPGCG